MKNKNDGRFRNLWPLNIPMQGANSVIVQKNDSKIRILLIRTLLDVIRPVVMPKVLFKITKTQYSLTISPQQCSKILTKPMTFLLLITLKVCTVQRNFCWKNTCKLWQKNEMKNLRKSIRIALSVTRAAWGWYNDWSNKNHFRIKFLCFRFWRNQECENKQDNKIKNKKSWCIYTFYFVS